MDRLEDILSTLEFALDTRRKKHIVGRILMSVSLLFGGLALTVITLRMEDDDDSR